MTWTTERIEKIPAIYRDFVLTLSPIVWSQCPDYRGLKFNGIPLCHIVNSLAARHDYSLQEFKEIAMTLKEEDLISEDHLGFFTPTSRGNR